MDGPFSPEIAALRSTSTAPGVPPSDDEKSSRSDGLGETVADISGNTWEVALFERPPPDGAAEGLYVYRNTLHLLPRAIHKLDRLNTLKFFANEIEVLPPEASDLVKLERLHVKVSAPRVSGFPIRKLESLKELELSMVLPRPSTFSILTELSGLKCLTKLSICHFSIRYLPPEIGSLKKLEELDLSFNKLKNLPDEIAELNALKSLKVANNKLVDLPSAVSSLRCLKSLDLSNNRLTSLTSLELASMLTLQYLNLQFNRVISSCEIPPWICCDMRGNGDVHEGDNIQPLADACVNDVARQRTSGSHSCNGCCGTCLCLCTDASLNLRIHAKQRLKNGWKRRDSLQERARQEHLNCSRNRKGEDDNAETTVNMSEEDDSCKLLDLEDINPELIGVDEDNLVDCSSESISTCKGISCPAGDVSCSLVKNSGMVFQDLADNVKIGSSKRSTEDDLSCITSEPTCLNKDYDIDNALDDSASSLYYLKEPKVIQEDSRETSKFFLNSKRHPDRDNNPKPSKFRKPVDNCSDLSYKYSVGSFCSVDDYLPDGFYDAGRDRPFMSIQEYERSLCLDSREIILLDREQDEELDAITFSAQMLLASLKRPVLNETGENEDDNLIRASILALFVSDCFGGCDRSASLMRTRRAVVSLNKQQPFVCTCSSMDISDSLESSRQVHGLDGNLNFSDLCDKSLWLMKERRKSNVVPIGSLQFGVCRHRAALMKYLCDRADPPIPCELVRGYLDFMPHAWNAVFVRRGNSWTRMIVDACYPTNIREETDPEYFCRYVPLSRLLVPSDAEGTYLPGCHLPFPSMCQEIEDTSASAVFHCKMGTVDAAVKVRYLDAQVASNEKIRDFEYKFLGEVRMLGALRRHKCIVDFYGHQLFCKWVTPADGSKDYRLLQSVIVMEYVKGGSLKGYLEKICKEGEKHVRVDFAYQIALDVACALVELHSKLIIHRDIKSENILIDLDSKGSNGAPIVKLSDFDQAIPLHSASHTCCIAHFGVHRPDMCVGTPRWMAPEVVQAMNHKNKYGLEVDIWSYGCLLLELLTLQIPYEGLLESEIYDLLQMKQRPRLSNELEAFSSLDKRSTRLKLGITSDADVDMLKLLVDLFYKCTEGNPADRPTAECIYNSLCSPSTTC